jgi:hypothetical protein
MMASRRIEVHVDHLLLDEVVPTGLEALEAGIAKEIARGLGGDLEDAGARTSTDGEIIDQSDPAVPLWAPAVGASVARAIGARFGRAPSGFS